jgi:hypothetical protein
LIRTLSTRTLWISNTLWARTSTRTPSTSKAHSMRAPSMRRLSFDKCWCLFDEHVITEYLWLTRPGKVPQLSDHLTCACCHSIDVGELKTWWTELCQLLPCSSLMSVVQCSTWISASVRQIQMQIKYGCRCGWPKIDPWMIRAIAYMNLVYKMGG